MVLQKKMWRTYKSMDSEKNLEDADIHHRRQMRSFAVMATLVSITVFLYTTYRLHKHNKMMEYLATSPNYPYMPQSL